VFQRNPIAIAGHSYTFQIFEFLKFFILNFFAKAHLKSIRFGLRVFRVHSRGAVAEGHLLQGACPSRPPRALASVPTGHTLLVDVSSGTMTAREGGDAP
jgi:hypothetical protein